MSLPRSAPHAQGVDAAGVLGLLDAVQSAGIDLHSLVVVRHGHVVAEGWWSPYAATRPHLAYSLSKTLTATAIGLLVQEGRLRLDDPVLDLLPTDVRAHAAPGWEAVLVRHCLSMTVGHDVDAWPALGLRGGTAPTDEWLHRVVATRLDHAPGEAFAYNQVATYVLSRIVAHLTGEGVLDVLRPRLLRPLGLLEEVPWHRDSAGHELGFSGSHLVTEAIAAVGQLHLDGGRWQGEQLLDPDWVAEATRAAGPLNREEGSGPDWRMGYGFSFWQMRGGYRGDGAFGQLMVVLPEHDLVVATTAATTEMQLLVDLVRGHLVPALDGRADDVGPAEAALVERLAGLRVPALAATAPAPGSVTASRVAGGETDLDPAYDRVEVAADGSSLVLHRGEEAFEVALGDGRWAESTWRREAGGGWSLPVAASGGWVEADRFVAEVLVVETAHRFGVEVRTDAAGSPEARLRWREVPLNGPDPWHSAARGPLDRGPAAG
ncbi:hypothetical protein ASG49_08505 [Marmoricola sp. Leaf446]|uniref:serine hydrolase domain-containing protein n=1 Tax=Marmoricola sp. Leaf446 TaxID=1736379 RepID=UPI0006F74917|nr:serine hydrolase domain-containing protein [Marmoricola sp. Leaf446]KQT92016.1 hypothetical protein ASG49_08505 [Marmoricola sp. Leaf446]